MSEKNRQREIVDYLEKNKGITTTLYTSLLWVSNDTALRELSKLRV
jgi:DeoR/GlpR family transcriptional regulator of sugar metabolism